jgi:hypothetical protein
MKSGGTVVHPLGDFCWFQRFEDACIKQGSGKKPGCPHFTTREFQAMGRHELEINFIPMHNEVHDAVTDFCEEIAHTAALWQVVSLGTNTPQSTKYKA